MRYMSFFKPGSEQAGPPPAEEMAKLLELIDEMSKLGVMVETGGLVPSAEGVRVKLDNGSFTMSDGPFAETKELIAGYAILEVESRDEAVHWTQRFLKVMGSGECEVRLMFEGCGPANENAQAAQCVSSKA